MPNYGSAINLNKNELQNAVVQNLATPPASPKAGQEYFDTVLGKYGIWNGTGWDYMGTSESSGDFSTNTASSVDGEVVVFSGTGGKTGKRATGSGIAKLTSGVLGTATAGTDFVEPNSAITGASKAKITYDAKGLVTSGADLVEADIPTLSQSKVTGLVSALAAAELLTNKSTSTSLGSSDTLYPTQKAVKTYTDNAISAAVAGLYDDRGSYSAAGNTFPASGGSGSAGAVLKGDIWTISTGGTLGGVAVTTGDLVRALSDTPGQTAGNWALTENNFGYVAENAANKVTAFSTPTDTQYPSAKLVSDQLALKAPLASPALTNPTATTPSTSDSSTKVATTAYVQAQGYGKKYTAQIGNGSATSFTVTHSLNTKSVIVSVRKVSTDDLWITDITAGNVNSITVAFGVAPTTNEFEVTVIG